MKKRWKVIAGLAVLFSALSMAVTGNADSSFESDTANTRASAENDNTITIYLDRKNQTSVRMAVAMYEREKSSSDPDIEWNLVDKSALEPEEFQKSLIEELYQGGGPDLVFVDEDSTSDPYLLMKNGFLLDITNSFQEMKERKGLEFYPAVESACFFGEQQYLIPLSIQTPVLFADKEALEASGFTENCPETYDELLSWAVDYQEQSGVCAFEDNSFGEELFLHSGMQYIDYETGEVCVQEEKLKKLCDAYMRCENIFRLAGSRSVCHEENLFIKTTEQNEIGDTKEVIEKNTTENTMANIKESIQHAFMPYEKIAAGTCLFSASGMSDYNRMAANLRILFSDGYDIAFQKVPTMQGEVQTVITHAMGINRSSERKELALTALEAFLSYHAMTEGQTGQGLPAVCNQGYWDVEFCYKVLGTTQWPDRYYQMDTSDPFTGADNLLDAYENAAGYSVEKAVFATGVTKTGGLVQRCMEGYFNGTDSFEESVTMLRQELEAWSGGYIRWEVTPASIGGEKQLQKTSPEEAETKVINVMYADHCLGMSHPLYEWLQDAADKMEKNGVHVNLIASWNPQPELYYGWLMEAGAEPDLMLCDEWAMSSELIVSQGNQYYDLSKAKEKIRMWCSDGMLENASVNGVLLGIPYGSDVMGLWCRKDILESAGFTDTEEIQSFDNLSELLLMIKEKDLSETPMLIQRSPSAMQAILQNTGNKIFDTDSEQVLVKEEAWVPAAAWLHGLGEKGLVKTVAQKEAAESLMRGETAVFLGFGNFLSMYQEDGSLPWDEYKENLMFIPLPGMQADISGYTMTDMNLFFVGKNTEHVDAVLDFIELCFASEVYDDMLEQMQMVSCRPADDSVYSKSLERAVSRSYSSHWPYHSLRNLLLNLTEAKMSVEECYLTFEKELVHRSANS